MEARSSLQRQAVRLALKETWKTLPEVFTFAPKEYRTKKASLKSAFVGLGLKD